MMDTSRPIPRRRWRAGHWQQASRTLPEEVPVALSFNGTTQAVMMATPADLRDFALGFALTEGLARPDEVTDLQIDETATGIVLHLWLVPQAGARLAARRRSMLGPVGCGLCGVDSIEAALGHTRPVPDTALHLSPGQVLRGMAALPAGQVLHDATRATHAAGFYTPGAGLVALREDVGRHNALDKLAGALLRDGADPATGAVLLTSRVSIDMVQKTAALGVALLIAASAPTAHAVRLAEAAGITLIGLARGDGFEAFTHTHRITEDEAADVA